VEESAFMHKTFSLCFTLSLVGCGAPAPSPRTPSDPTPAAATTLTDSGPHAAKPATSASTTLEIPDYVRSAVAAPDRSDADRALDGGRQPDKMLAFFGIRPGMQVAEIGAGGGYTSELLARVVGSSGKVYGENPKVILERFANEPWTARLAKPALQNVVRADRELDDPLPPAASELDAVLSVLIYHDTVWLGADRDKMNQAVFRALKHGGVYGIVDHSAPVGSGLTVVQTTHRIDEKTLRAEVERAGFRLAGEGDFLRNPKDTRDWNDSPKVAGERRGTSDRFVLKYVKP
jgi:predicted methyltransferase